LIGQPPRPAAVGGILLGDDVFQLALGTVKRSLRNTFGLRGFFDFVLGDRTICEDGEQKFLGFIAGAWRFVILGRHRN
jgi:hypothetical protein